MLINRQGKIRLVKWYEANFIQDKYKYMREVAVTVIGRSSRLCNFLEWGEYKIVYKRYASLYFITLVDKDDNELTVLELIHHFVEFLDRYFGSVCELDIFLIIIKPFILMKKLLLVAIFKKVIKKIF